MCCGIAESGALLHAMAKQSGQFQAMRVDMQFNVLHLVFQELRLAISTVAINYTLRRSQERM